MSPRKIGAWVLDRPLGEGGMGRVFLAHHAVTGAPAALKELSPEIAANEQLQQRFLNEAKTHMGLRHEHIAFVQDFILEPGECAMVVEYLPGGSLADKIDEAKGPLDPHTAITWVRQALSALDYAHQRGVIHRDIKPQNLMLDEHGKVKVADFGIAMVVGAEKLTRTQSTLGTSHYMSPEQIQDPHGVTHLTDLYSMGLVLYELLTGQLPFDGPSDASIMVAQATQPPPPPRTINPAISESLEAIILRALAKNPAERFGGCAEFAGALDDFEQGLPPLPMASLRRRTVIETSTAPDAANKLTAVASVGPQPEVKGLLLGVVLWQACFGMLFGVGALWYLIRTSGSSNLYFGKGLVTCYQFLVCVLPAAQVASAFLLWRKQSWAIRWSKLILAVWPALISFGLLLGWTTYGSADVKEILPFNIYVSLLLACLGLLLNYFLKVSEQVKAMLRTPSPKLKINPSDPALRKEGMALGGILVVAIGILMSVSGLRGCSFGPSAHYYVDSSSIAPKLKSKLGNQVKFLSVTVYPNMVSAELQDPASKGNVDDYLIRNGSVFKGDPAVMTLNMKEEDIESCTADLDLIDFSVIPKMAKDALAVAKLKDGEITHMIAKTRRNAPPIWWVYMSDKRGRSQTSEFDAKGNLLEAKAW